MKHTIPIAFRLVLCAALSAASAAAQTTGSCAPAEAEAYLDAGNVRARIFNNGALFWKGDPFVYEVPNGGGASALYTTTLLVGGMVGDQLRTAAARYQRFEFWPGPLDDDGHAPVDCAPFDHLYEITSDDIAAYNTTGVPSQNLADWPWHLGAPVLDGDGHPNNYDLDTGDRPALRGDQMLWWIMNDSGGEHEETKTQPLGLEVRGTAFSYRSDDALGNTTFYHYDLTYKGAAPLEDAYVGLFADVELGNFADDFIGSDTTLHLGFAYNADNLDEGGGGYGVNPPAVGYTVLRGPLAEADGLDNDHDGTVDEPGERLGLTSVSCFLKGGGDHGEPGTAAHYYHCLRGFWPNGDPITVGGTGEAFSETTTRFLFPGDPVAGTFWSEVNDDDQGGVAVPADRRFVLGSGPFTMQPGETETFAFAIVWARGADHLDSVRKLKEDVAGIRQDAERLLQPDDSFLLAGETAPSDRLPDLAQNYPNPFTGRTTIRYRLPRSAHVRLAVYDVLGRRVAALVDERQHGGVYEVPFEAGGLPPGVYIYRIEMEHLTFTRRMALIQ